ncbi:uncharacterized protein LOC142537250 [Primulina tabacum]|uniref:uncharacterized protein LOC142537250 n=1 Tax=Primulina tabacum TaxID=48773 RepID=UPI003F5ABD12
MSSGQKWKQLKSIFTPHGDCGCGPNATDIIEPKPKLKSTSSDQKPSRCPSSSNSSWEIHGGLKSITDGDEDCTSTTVSLDIDIDNSPPLYFPETDKNHPKVSKTVSSCPKIHDCFAVVKDSDDPYQDFSQSMLQMIFENEIYSRRDLQQLLDCFLQLNSPQHHETILQAFMEICSGGDGTEIDR